MNLAAIPLTQDPAKPARRSRWMWFAHYAAWGCLFLGSAIRSVENGGGSRRLAVASARRALIHKTRGCPAGVIACGEPHKRFRSCQ